MVFLDSQEKVVMLRDRAAVWSSMIKDDTIEEEEEDDKETMDGSKVLQETKEAASRWISEQEENFSGASIMHLSRISDSVNVSLRWMERYNKDYKRNIKMYLCLILIYN